MNTIQPFSNISFCKKPNKIQPITSEFHSKKTIEKEKDWSFLTGALCAAAIMCAIHQCDSNKREVMLNEIATELKYSDPEKIQIKVIDGTKDEVPDFIIEDNYGAQSIYDIKNNHKYYKDKFEFEKIY